MSVIPAPTSRSGRLLLLAAAGFLICGGCAAVLYAGSAPRDCPRPQARMAGLSAKTFEGHYTGPDGMRVHLGRDGSGRAHVRADNWPFDLFDLDDGEVGESETGEVRKFSGSGSWEYGAAPVDGEEDAGGSGGSGDAKAGGGGRQYPYISLDFTEGRPADDLPASPQYLMLGGTRAHPVLFEQEDSDACPEAVFRRESP
ncbi:hypothetical protein [Streptomyces sp. ODS28]|uniref:hypothetical protein n=1 Tax=Streptomyces sp. ODS28 TaxID=3136688 RepID=UPI0031E91236